jgi:SnoaL-like domain
MDLTQKLAAIEEIKVLKARYFRCLDAKDWDGWRKLVFCANSEMLVPEAQPEPVIGIDRIITFVEQVLRGTVTIHHGHMPEISIQSDTEASGIWAMEDVIYWPKDRLAQSRYSKLQGYGHYHERYVRESSGWRIQSLLLSRLHIVQTE